MKILNLVFLISLAACSTSSNKKIALKDAPNWVNGSDEKYPDSTYWLGVGTGKTRQEAAQNARGELGKRVESKVSTNESSSSSESSDESLGHSYEKQVSLESNAILNDTRIAEWWQDSSSKEHYALALLQKGKFVAEIQRKIDKIDDALEAMTKNLVNSFRAFDLIREREVWEKHYSAIAGGPAVDNPWDMSSEELLSKRNDVLARHPFKLVGEELHPLVQEMLQYVGFVINPTSENELRIDVKTKEFPSSPNLNRQKVTIKVDAITKKSQASMILSEIGVGHTDVQSLEDGYKKIRSSQVDKLFSVVKALGDVKL